MAQPERAPLPQPARRPRRADLFEDPLQFLWAVSYADLLMVLMSFFVIYFQMSDAPDAPQLPPAVRDVVLALRRAAEPAVPAAAKASPLAAPSAAQVAPPPAAREAAPELQEVAQALRGARLPASTETHLKGVILHFPDSFYPVGGYTVDSRRRAALDRVLSLLRPYASRVQLTFIGHTDTSPVSVTKGKVVDSNLVLSNMRSGKAVEYAVRSGFDPRWLTAQGAGQFARNTRSLSLRITSRATEELDR